MAEPTADSAGRLIRVVVAGAREPTEEELRAALEQIAQAGFPPHRLERVRGRLAGMIWQGRLLRGADLLPPAEVHYLWHVVKRGEWPVGTDLTEYVQSLILQRQFSSREPAPGRF